MRRFEVVEFLFPYGHAPDELPHRLEENHLENILVNMPAGYWAAGEPHMASIPGHSEEFRGSVSKALTYASGLGALRLNAMTGIPPAGADTACQTALIKDLKQVCSPETR